MSNRRIPKDTPLPHLKSNAFLPLHLKGFLCLVGFFCSMLHESHCILLAVFMVNLMLTTKNKDEQTFKIGCLVPLSFQKAEHGFWTQSYRQDEINGF